MKLLSGLIVGFIIGVLATVGFQQFMKGGLSTLTGQPAAVAPAPAPPAATGGAPSDTNTPVGGSETGTPPKSP